MQLEVGAPPAPAGAASQILGAGAMVASPVALAGQVRLYPNLASIGTPVAVQVPGGLGRAPAGALLQLNLLNVLAPHGRASGRRVSAAPDCGQYHPHQTPDLKLSEAAGAQLGQS